LTGKQDHHKKGKLNVNTSGVAQKCHWKSNDLETSSTNTGDAVGGKKVEESRKGRRQEQQEKSRPITKKVQGIKTGDRLSRSIHNQLSTKRDSARGRAGDALKGKWGEGGERGKKFKGSSLIL